MSDYYTKLKDPRWQRRRLQIMERADFHCEMCGESQKQLSVHHIYYISKRDPWKYPDQALRCLCNDCHKEKHERCDSEEPSNYYAKEYFEQLLEMLDYSDDDDFSWDSIRMIALAKKALSKDQFKLWLGNMLQISEELTNEILTKTTKDGKKIH